MDVLETMTPQQFAAFRPELGSSSGFQSSQFRYIEAVLGRRDFSAAVDRPGPRRDHGTAARLRLAAALPDHRAAGRSPPRSWTGTRASRGTATAPVQALLAEVYADAGTPAEVCEALVDIDEGIQEWRYRHVKMVERIIGAKTGTGGSTGAAYLRGTLFRPAFPDLWEIRSRP